MIFARHDTPGGLPRRVINTSANDNVTLGKLVANDNFVFEAANAA